MAKSRLPRRNITAKHAADERVVASFPMTCTVERVGDTISSELTVITMARAACPRAPAILVLQTLIPLPRDQPGCKGKQSIGRFEKNKNWLCYHKKKKSSTAQTAIYLIMDGDNVFNIAARKNRDYMPG